MSARICALQYRAMTYRAKIFSVTVALMLLASAGTAYARTANGGAQTRVLQGIPAIAKAFAPVGGVGWEDFARTLAGICAVESVCDPTYPHWVNGGVWSQYQGLYQMNMAEVQRAELYLSQVLPQMRQMTQSGQIPKDAMDFFEKAVAARGSVSDRRFHPEYGVILGAAKHIQIHKQIEAKYRGDPVRQGAAHMLAQFSGITESKIKAGNWNSPIGGSIYQKESEAWALGLNRVQGGTVATAVESAGSAYGKKMADMMTRMSQVTNGMTSVPPNVAPFTTPAFNPGTNPQLGVHYGGASTLMETGFIPPVPAQPVQQPVPGVLPPLSNTQISAENQVLQTTSGTQTSTTQSGTSTSAISNDPNTPAVPVNPAALIIVQPNPVTGGRPASLSWTSVGMSKARLCQVTESGKFVAQGNEGTLQVITQQTSSQVTLTFLMQCTTLGGTVIQRTASVNVI